MSRSLPTPPRKEGEPELERYLRVVRERRWVLLASACAAFALFLSWASRQPRLYQATASIVVSSSPPQVLGGEVRDVMQVGPGQFWEMADYIQTQRQVLLSKSLARRVVERLKLMGDPDFWVDGQPKDVDEAAHRLVASTATEHILDTQIITASFLHRVPAQAKRAVDGLVDAFIEQNVELRDSSNLNASHFLADEADNLRARLSTAELALYDFKRKNDLLSVALEDRINNVSRQIDKLSDALTEARLRKVAHASEAGELSTMMTSDPDRPVAGSPQGAEALAGLKTDLVQEERRLSELQSRYEDAHPLVRQQAAKVHSVQAGIRREIELQLRSAQARTNQSASEERQIAAQLEQAKQEGLRITRLEIEYNKLKREADALNKQYLMVQNRNKETELASKVKANNLHVLDYSDKPGSPVSPHLVRAGVFAVSCGLLVGFLLALLIDALDRSLKTQEDVEGDLGVPFLGLMPRVANKEVVTPDLHVYDHPQSPAAECCRLVRTNLLFTGLSRPVKRILVTSPVAREGKTMNTVSLGVVMAQAGTKVLLIDSDLRRPRLRSALGMTGPEGEVGLTSVLLGDVPLDQAIQPTKVPNLFVLLSGPVPPNPAELVEGTRFRELIEECADRFERVLIDSPPAVPVADPAIISGYCDGVVLVVRAGKTGREQALRAARNLSDVGARILGVVLNDCEISRSRYGAYRYGYGYYGAAEEQPGSRKKARG